MCGTFDLVWFSYHKPRSITQGNGWDSQFWYDAERSRWKQSSLGGFGNEVRYYVGGIYEKVFTGGVIEHHHFIQVAGRTVALVKRVSGNETVRWLHHDHLGSLEVMTDSNGNPVGERQSYDAWGKRRDPVTWVTPRTGLAIGDGSYTPALFTRRGYTGHEHLDHLDLIHMNGRVYSPEAGRFLSPDPFVQFPEDVQGLNRYAYLGNNPLNGTDPSGYFDLKQAVGIAVMFVPIPGVNVALSAAITGAVGGYLSSGGDLRAAALGAMAGAFSANINAAYAKSAFSDTSQLANFAGAVGAQAATAGVLSLAGGGKYQDGFLGSAVGFAFSAKVSNVPGGTTVEIVAAAVVGGTAAEIGGGKFGNGAIAAAFSYAIATTSREIERRWARPFDGENGQIAFVGGAMDDKFGPVRQQYEILVASGGQAVYFTLELPASVDSSEVGMRAISVGARLPRRGSSSRS